MLPFSGIPKVGWSIMHVFCFSTYKKNPEQGRSQPHSPGWARVPLSSFFPQSLINSTYFSSNFTYFLPHFGPPGGRVTHLGRSWLRHWSRSTMGICHLPPDSTFSMLIDWFVHICQQHVDRCVSLFPLRFWGLGQFYQIWQNLKGSYSKIIILAKHWLNYQEKASILLVFWHICSPNFPQCWAILWHKPTALDSLREHWCICIHQDALATRLFYGQCIKFHMDFTASVRTIIGWMPARFTQLKSSKRFDNFIMLVWGPRINISYCCQVTPCTGCRGNIFFYLGQILKLPQCCQKPYQQILVLTIQKKYSLTYLRHTVS